MGVNQYYVKLFCNVMRDHTVPRERGTINEWYHIVTVNLRRELNDGYIDIESYRYYQDEAHNAYKEAIANADTE